MSWFGVCANSHHSVKPGQSEAFMVFLKSVCVFCCFWVTERNEDAWTGFSQVFFSSPPKSLLECPIRQQSALRSVSDRPSSAPAAAADQCEASPATGASPLTGFKLWLQISLKIRYGGAPENKGAIWLRKGRKASRLSLLTQIFEAFAATPGENSACCSRKSQQVGLCQFSPEQMFHCRNPGKFRSDLALAEGPREKNSWSGDRQLKDAYFSKHQHHCVLLFISSRLLLPCGKGHFRPSRSPPCWIGSHRSSFLEFKVRWAQTL